MKITFYHSAFEVLAVEYLSAVLKSAGHAVTLVYDHRLFDDAWISVPTLSAFFEGMDSTVDAILKSAPDMVCFSVVTDDWIRTRKLASMLKKKQPDLLVMAGGIHITSVPEHVINCPEIDFACIGEGEEAVVELADRLERGIDITGTRNFYIRSGEKIIRNKVRPLIANLDELPYPDKEIFFRPAPYFSKSYLTMSSRGCPWSCPFCHHNVEKKVYGNPAGYFRQHSVQRMINELKQAMSRWDIQMIIIEDDMLLNNRDWAIEFCYEYSRQIGLPWTCVAHPAQIDMTMAGSLAEAGCSCIEIGVQSFNQNLKKEVLGRHESNMTVIKALEALNKNGLRFDCDHIAGFPGETEQDLLKAARVYSHFRPNRIMYMNLTYFPGTDIVDYSYQRGLISKQDVEDGIRGVDRNFVQVRRDRRRHFGYFRFIFAYIPLLPAKIILWLLKKHRYRYLPSSSLFCRIIPEVLGLTVLGKVNTHGRRMIRRYLFGLISRLYSGLWAFRQQGAE